MTQTADKPLKTRQRRKEARPGELVEVALECFLEKGFEATRLDDVAKRGGVAKGTVYVYFETKEQLFRAVVKHVIAAHSGGIVAAAMALDGDIEENLPALMDLMVSTVGSSKAPAVARLILREADRFPDLARIWFEDAVSPLLQAIEHVILGGQARGEIRDGDPRIHMLSVFAPIVVGVLMCEIATPLGFATMDVHGLARQHADTVLHGLLKAPARKGAPR